jgi:hypothetical protein
MPTIFERLLAPAGTWLANQIAFALTTSTERITEMRKRREYYEGVQKKPLKLKPGQADDNLISNFTALAVDRANAMLFGGGVQFKLPGGDDSPEAEYIDSIWKANKKNILLNRWGQDGEIYGTGYIKIIPDALEYSDAIYPRLQVINPALMEIFCDPMDMDRVLGYIFEVKIDDSSAFREVTRRTKEGELLPDPSGDESAEPIESDWVVEQFESKGRSAKWELIKSTPWPYPFPPIVHHHNLPSIHGVYGTSGIAGLLDTQDKYNQVVSNELKIIRYHAHPKTWGRGLPANAAMEKISWGGDEMIKISDPQGAIANLEMNSDLGSTRNLAQTLRQTIFDLARVVDIASIVDKAGQLTNFGLRVLYSDALSKNSVRRALYGDALQEINRRMLILNDMDGNNEIVWGADLPSDEADDAKLIREDLAAGLVSKETASQMRGYTWNTSADGVEIGEEDRIAEEQANTGQTQNTALANFFAGNNR